MNASVKAALLSGLVFPGLGQLVLGAKRRGTLLIVGTLSCLTAMIVVATRKALMILDTLAREGRPLDMQSIREAAEQASAPPGSLVFNLFLFGLVLCWLYAIVDAYRTAKHPLPFGRDGET